MTIISSMMVNPVAFRDMCIERPKYFQVRRLMRVHPAVPVLHQQHSAQDLASSQLSPTPVSTSSGTES
jgi:hypothetical protein